MRILGSEILKYHVSGFGFTYFPLLKIILKKVTPHFRQESNIIFHSFGIKGNHSDLFLDPDPRKLMVPDPDPRLRIRPVGICYN
jgi:hypothetical protein